MGQWDHKAEELRKAKRILILCGSNSPLSESEVAALELFAKHYNCVIATENYLIFIARVVLIRIVYRTH